MTTIMSRVLAVTVSVVAFAGCGDQLSATPSATIAATADTTARTGIVEWQLFTNNTAITDTSVLGVDARGDTLLALDTLYTPDAMDMNVHTPEAAVVVLSRTGEVISSTLAPDGPAHARMAAFAADMAAQPELYTTAGPCTVMDIVTCGVACITAESGITALFCAFCSTYCLSGQF